MGMHNSRKLQLEQATLMLFEFIRRTGVWVDAGQDQKVQVKAHYGV